MAWLAAGAWLDPRVGPGGQRLIGAATWALLLGLLRWEDRTARVQVLSVAALAGSLEILARALDLYHYRLGNIPAFVPPGHGLVFLASLALSRAPLLTSRPERAMAVAIAAGGAWALWGVTLSTRPDTAGALFFVFWLGLMVGGRAPMLLTGAFLVTGVVEVAGTQTGSWTWMPEDPAGLLSAGNPPSGVAGIYGWVDVIVLNATPALLTGLAAVQRHALAAVRAAREALARGEGASTAEGDD